MKINSFKIYKWHSINLVPHYSSTAVCTDEPPFSITGRWYALTVFGWVISLVVSHGRAEAPSYMTKVHGPLWSRRRKRWYRIND